MRLSHDDQMRRFRDLPPETCSIPEQVFKLALRPTPPPPKERITDTVVRANTRRRYIAVQGGIRSFTALSVEIARMAK